MSSSFYLFTKIYRLINELHFNNFFFFLNFHLNTFKPQLANHIEILKFEIFWAKYLKMIRILKKNAQSNKIDRYALKQIIQKKISII